MRREVIEGVPKHVHENYPYPEAVAGMERTLRERLAQGEYEGVTSGDEFAKLLTAHLQGVREDPHLRVESTAEPGVSNSPTATTVLSPEEQRRQEEHWQLYGAARNYFVDRVERLAGNVGYLKLSAFFFVDMTKDSLAAAMNLVADTDALLVDLRQCGGGDVATTELFEHYFFAEAADPNLLGTRYLDGPVFLLMSQDNYSAPEAWRAACRPAVAPLSWARPRVAPPT